MADLVGLKPFYVLCAEGIKIEKGVLQISILGAKFHLFFLFETLNYLYSSLIS